jgi:RNA polymerase sigma-70 factor (ECF subfamily)
VAPGGDRHGAKPHKSGSVAGANYSDVPADRATYPCSVNRIGRRHVSQRVAVWRNPRGLTAARVDEADLERLVDQHGAVLLAYATHLTGDRSQGEDVAQETLLRAWTHPEALDPERGSARAWLLTVARNVVRDQARARRARPHEVTDEIPEGLLGSVDDEIDLAVESWVVAEALAELTPDHRAVLVETFYRGRSVRQAATFLEIPEGTVKSRTFYALRALKVALTERGVIS